MTEDSSEWEHYWAKKQSRFVYDIIAEFYRQFIIRPSFNRFIRKYFKPGEKILHAGCGSGQLDSGIQSHLKITALDISKNALKIYQNENGEKCQTVLGNLFSLPFESCEFDGIYNLGVMEHFSEQDVKKILKEFRRVIKKNGKIILFWPPSYGTSVLFFKMLKKLLYLITRKHFIFHPPELCQLQGRSHALSLLEGSHFELVEYAFGARDLFTQVVLVAKAI